MTNGNQDEVMAKLQGERSRLEERLHMLEAEQPSAPGEGSHIETPNSVREQLAQVNRMIETHKPET